MSLEVSKQLHPSTDSSLLFYSNKYLLLNFHSPYYSFSLKENDNILSQLFLTTESKDAFSFKGTSFGGFDFIQSIDANKQSFFLKRIIYELKNKKQKSLSITLPPFCYSSLHPKEQSIVLKELGFLKTNEEINFHIDTTKSETLWNQLHPSEKNKYNKALKSGIKIRQLPSSFFTSCFDLIKKNRLFKGFPITISEDTLKKLNSELEEFYLFGAFKDDILIATCISIRVTSTVLYNFYMADDPDFRTYSPLVLLNSFIYDWCKKQGINTIDLGTASSNGNINAGLANFKKHLGGIETPKKTYKLLLQ